ncbi:MAG: CARDB domain-containing protein [Chloroflexota bacterium]
MAARGITVRGSEPGSQRCEPGRNTVTVLVKNEGQAAASGFRMKLEADGDDYEQQVAGLDGGKEVSVSFPNVEL